MATTNKRFVAKNGIDNNGNTITNVGASGNSLGLSGTGDLTVAISGTATLTVPATTDTLVTLASIQTLTNKTISGADNTLTNIGNGSLTNSSITINGTSVSLGGTRTLVTDDIAEDGSPVNLWFTDTRSRAAISVTDSGGDGSLAYDSGTGVITYTGPSASEVRAHFSAGTGVTITSGQVAIGQAVATTDNVSFAGVTADNIRVGVTGTNEIDTSAGNLTIDSTGGTTVMDDDVNVTGNLQIDGNLTVSGTTVTVNATNLAVEDNMIYLNNGSAVANPDLGFAGNYNDGTYRHAGIFRDASDGVWKFFHEYTPEPDASAYIDITHGSFALAPIQASAVTATTFTGSSLTVSGDLTVDTSTLKVDSTNNGVGIGTTSLATNYPLTIRSQVADYTKIMDWGTAAGGSWGNMTINTSSPYETIMTSGGWKFDGGNFAVDTNTLYVDATNNRVGIGTTNPANKLQIGSVGSSGYGGNDFVIGNGTQVMAFYNYSGGPSTWFTNTNFALMNSGAGSTGNVGIGTTSPAAKLDILGDNNQLYLTTNGNYASIYPHHSGTNTGAIYWNTSGVLTIEGRTATGQIIFGTGGTSIERMRINASGNVGIGNTNPPSLLSLQASNTTAYDATIDNGQDDSGVSLTVRNGDTSTVGSFSQLCMQVSGDSGRALGRIVTIRMGSATSDMAFVTENANTKAEKMRITAAGNVGIGTTNPSGRLHIVNTGGGTTATNYLNIEGATGDNSNYPGIQLTGGTLANVYPQLTLTNGGLATVWSVGYHTSNYPQRASISMDAANYGIAFNTSTTGAVSERMRINSSGNVGIGTTNPGSYKLYVQGDQYISGTLTEASSIALKENINPITDALSIISNLTGYTYDRKDGTARQQAGLIAEEVEHILPNIVSRDVEGNASGVQYTKIIAYLVESIKELKKELDTLKN